MMCVLIICQYSTRWCQQRFAPSMFFPIEIAIMLHSRVGEFAFASIIA